MGVAFDSPALAARLRAGPLRSIVDRLVRGAAEAVGVPYMVLGLRHGELYEFIATHGIPLSHYIEQVPAHQMSTKLFAREVEVPDLQRETQFIALNIAPIAKRWRYGGSVPVRTERLLSDGGVLALSCADTEWRTTGGQTLTILRGYAELIGDLIWLSSQIRQSDVVTDPAAVVGTVLQTAVARVSLPVCIMNERRQLVGLTDAFVSVARELGGPRPRPGEVLTGPWLTPELDARIAQAIADEAPAQWLPVIDESERRVVADVYPFSFAALGRFAIFALHYGARPKPNLIMGNGMDDRTSVDSAAPANPDGPGPVSRFLMETLVTTHRLNRRNHTSYLGVRRWRSAIKAHQIAALRALKMAPPQCFIDAIVAELAEAVRAVYGAPGSCVVVPVPCGHSGPDCLSARLARGLADYLGTEVVEAVVSAPRAKGSSHPKRNAARPSFRLAHKIDRPVILVDDVATSGSHIDEAARLLRTTAPWVWPVVWIAP